MVDFFFKLIEESQLESVRAWFQKIKARAPKAPVLLVGTHKDLIPEDELDQFHDHWYEEIEEIRNKVKFSNLKDQLMVNANDFYDRENFKKCLLAQVKIS